MTITARLGITHIEESQSNKEVTANTAFDKVDKAIAGLLTHNMTADADYALLTTDAGGNENLNAVIKITDTGPVLTASRNIVVPALAKVWYAINATAQPLVFKTSAGTGVTVAAGEEVWIRCDGVNVVAMAAPGSVAAAGAVMESDTSTADMQFVIDEDDMASDSATKVPTQQSVKAYADAGAASVTAYVDGNFVKFTMNDIGRPGTAGFGVGVCPPSALPDGMTPLFGCTDRTHPNYGNYQFSDGSIMCYVPKFWYKVGTGANGLPVNRVDIKSTLDFEDPAAANAEGYALHRAFIDGGVEQGGFFIDKYMCSKNALGAGYVASSIKGGLPISTHPDHNPIADLTACSGNYYYEAINACHARDGVDGAVNVNSIFHCASRFQWAALAMLSLSHGQAAANGQFCGWFDASYSFPKGCNNNALGDTNDSSVAYVSDGYSTCGKTGSGNPPAKVAHNGQACGVADVNGLMYEIQIGITCIATGKSITAATQGSLCQLTIVGHGRNTGDPVMITGVGGMTAINDRIFAITVVDADNVTLDGVDSSAFGAYTSGGTATFGDFYAAKQATAMKDFSSGNSSATDHWGPTGVTAMMDAIGVPLRTDYPNNGFSLRWGNGSNQVLAEDASGDPWVLTGLGLPETGQNVSSSGTNLFGTDYFYQYIRNELCLVASMLWNSGSAAGVWGLYLNVHRPSSNYAVGFRAACYPVA